MQHKIANIFINKLRRDAAGISKRWTIHDLSKRDLLNNPERLLKDNEEQVPLNNSKRTRPVQIDTARVLLHDVKLRLASQYVRCTDMLDQIDNESAYNKISFAKPTPNAATITSDKKGEEKRIIRAVNISVTRMTNNKTILCKSTQEQNQINYKQQQAKAKRILDDISALHLDTFRLIDEITQTKADDELPVILKRFSIADQNYIASIFEQIRSRHASTVESIAEMIVGLRQSLMTLKQPAPPMIDEKLIHAFLEYRLGIQLLCDHYVALNKGKKHGGISVKCNFWEVLQDAVTEARSLCDANCGISPEVFIMNHYDHRLKGDNPFHLKDALEQECSTVNYKQCDLKINDILETENRDVTHVTIVRPWVHHVLVELIKNALSSSVQKHLLLDDCGSKNKEALNLPPPVHIRIVDKCEDYLAILVIDRGSGLSSIDRSKLFTFAGRQQLWDRLDDQQSYADVRAPLAGLGVGLSLSRMMMRMFGGEVMLHERWFLPVQEQQYSNTRQADKVEHDANKIANNNNLQGKSDGCIATIILRKDVTVSEWKEEERLLFLEQLNL